MDKELEDVFKEYDDNWAEIVKHGENSPELNAVHEGMMSIRKLLNKIDETRLKIDITNN